MKKIFPVFFCITLLPCSLLTAQGYQALHGSAFAGSTEIFNNPASSVNAAYKWDLTLFSTQFKISTNALYLKNFTLSNNDSASLTLKEDYNSKFIHANFDISLLNLLYKIDNSKAVSFGIRARSYTHSKTLPFQYSDSISSLHNFLMVNDNTPYLHAFVTTAGWVEADLNYSQVLAENSHSKLSGGVTLQVMKGMVGAFLKLNKVSYLESKSAAGSSFTFTDGGASFAYSANLGANSLKDFSQNSLNALGISLGVEYLLYKDDMNQVNNDLNYNWKIGASLMDLGANTFKPSDNSATSYGPISSITDGDIDRKISNTSSAQDLKDSLNTIFSNNTDITENFNISLPTRLVVNIDKNLGNHFYVNGELSMNFYSTSSYTKLHTRELNLLTITPRWETIAWGAYFPIQYNTQGQLWIGMAVKLGPLVIGFHNFGLLKKDPLLNGGGYLLFSIHPFSKRRVLSKQDCPE